MSAPAHRSAPNNFDTLRLLLAAIVAIYHLAVLSQRPEFAWLRSPVAADFAVKAFFVVSGFLVTQSLRNTRTLREYFEKRARRLLPGYVAVVVGSVLVGALMTSWDVEAFLRSADTWRYVVWNLLFLNYKAMTLPGVFDNPEAHPFLAVNGSLWTIKVEVGFYLLLPVLLLFIRRLGLWPVVIAMYLAGIGWRHGMYELAAAPNGERFAGLATHLPGQLAYFACGIAIQILNPSRRMFLAAGAIAAALMLGGPLGRIVAEPVLYAVCALGFALHLPYLGNAARHGDFSYGLYLIHFPVLQVMIDLKVFDRSAWLSALGFVVVIAALSWASWTFVEQPFLRRKRKPAPEAHPQVAFAPPMP